MPAIIAMWHGQHFLAPFVKRNDGSHRAKVLISRHRDGEINALAAERLGIGTIRGSGAHDGEFHRKGGVGAFTEMLDALDEGYNVALTADVPKVARVAGLGIVKLAQHSGRPIYPVAIATQPPHRARQLGSHRDQSAVRPLALVASEPIYVPRDADDATLEAARQRVESELNRATARAYEIADRHRERGSRERQAAGSAARLPAAVGGGDAARAAAAGAPAQARQGASRAPARAARRERHGAAAGPAGLAAWRQRRRIAQRPAADRAHPRARASTCW